MFEFDFKDNSLQELDRFVEEVLDKIDAKSGTRRKNMFKRAHGMPEPKHSYSVTYGYTGNSYMSPTKSRVKVQGLNNVYETTILTNHPELKGIFQKLVNLHHTEPLIVDQIQINRNWWSPPHKDSGNVGISSIIGLGDYEGGETVVEYPKEHIEYDIKNKFVSFNGSRYTHWTKPFEGKRYSLVFYKHKLSN
tara:strand:+ start:1833 stop:2408 length:576 start_codon:yes stop_codon:yes gene_type:complete